MSETTTRPKKRVNSYDRDAPTPVLGSRWIWEYGNPYAQETITVTDVKWNGEEWWVQARGSSLALLGRRESGVEQGNGTYWNDLSRFWEAVTSAPKRP